MDWGGFVSGGSMDYGGISWGRLVSRCMVDNWGISRCRCISRGMVDSMSYGVGNKTMVGDWVGNESMVGNWVGNVNWSMCQGNSMMRYMAAMGDNSTMSMADHMGRYIRGGGSGSKAKKSGNNESLKINVSYHKPYSIFLEFTFIFVLSLFDN